MTQLQAQEEQKERSEQSQQVADCSIISGSPTLGDYRLVSKIGQGGIAIIYKAIQMSLDREVAVKILSSKLSSDPEIVRRFDRESRTIARLNHPNIVHVIDRGFAEGRYFFAMEYVEGASFKETLASHEMPLTTKLEVIVMTLKGLDYAHKNGVVHRDIKPANILIDMHGNAKVADFGIAHLVNTPDAEATSSHMVMGTMAYMSPEQKVSSANVDETTDIYAVGVMLYETLVGQKPLGKFKLPSEIDSRIPQGFDRIVERSLATNKTERYQSAVAFKDDLLELTAGQTGAKAQPNVGAAVSGVDSIVGSCRFLDTIRESTHGSTYLVEDNKTKKLIIIKRFNRDNIGLKEARALARMDHPNLVNIIGAGGDANKSVVVMEYAPGGSLADRLVRNYNWREAFTIGQQIAAGLSSAHKSDIFHGNLRPSNVLFDADETVKISDFGSPLHYTSRKNWYSAPEKGVTARGDIYALGVILHQMLFGKTPEYSRHGRLQIEELAADIPERAVEIMRKLLELQSAERYQSCDELLADWKDLSEGKAQVAMAQPTGVSSPQSLKTSQGTSRGLVMLAIGLFVGMALGIAISYSVGFYG